MNFMKAMQGKMKDASHRSSESARPPQEYNPGPGTFPDQPPPSNFPGPPATVNPQPGGYHPGPGTFPDPNQPRFPQQPQFPGPPATVNPQPQQQPPPQLYGMGGSGGDYPQFPGQGGQQFGGGMSSDMFSSPWLNMGQQRPLY